VCLNPKIPSASDDTKSRNLKWSNCPEGVVIVWPEIFKALQDHQMQAPAKQGNILHLLRLSPGLKIYAQFPRHIMFAEEEVAKIGSPSIFNELNTCKGICV
jgi:hypothetical protein